MALASERMSAMVRCCLARCCAVSRFGMAIAATMPRKATTRSTTTTTMTMISAVLPPPVFAGTAGGGAPLAGLPHRGQGAYETLSTGLPHQAQYSMPPASLPVHAELQLRCFRHHGAVPHRVEDHFHVCLPHAGQRLELRLHVVGQHRTHAAAGRGER